MVVVMITNCKYSLTFDIINHLLSVSFPKLQKKINKKIEKCKVVRKPFRDMMKKSLEYYFDRETTLRQTLRY